MRVKVLYSLEHMYLACKDFCSNIALNHAWPLNAQVLDIAYTRGSCSDNQRKCRSVLFAEHNFD